ncbi:Uncharacterized protein FKW44_013984, partial [Caligus rogercresseyi]
PSFHASYIDDPKEGVPFDRQDDINEYIIQEAGFPSSSTEYPEFPFKSSPLEVILYPDSAKELLNSRVGQASSFSSSGVLQDISERPGGIIPLILRSAKDDLKLIGNAIQYALEK